MLTTVLKNLRLRVAFAGALCFACTTALAQIPPNFGLPNQFQRALQNVPGNSGQQNLQTTTPNVGIYQPVNPETRPEAPPSRLESLYSQRAARRLTQFGYDILGVPTPVSSMQVGAAQDSYVLGEGDELTVVLRGQEDQTYRELVNRDGQVILPRLNPILAAGRTLGEFRADLERQVAQTYISTNAFVSLGNIRQVSVLVTGEVRAPGARYLSALATPLDAILISGGIAKTGSLRNVTLVRGNQTLPIDLYGLLTQAGPIVLPPLRNGDRIYVAPLQNTVAIAGAVRRPAIYELKNGEIPPTASALIGLAGGLEIPGAYRLSKMQLEPDGTTRLVTIAPTTAVANGEILFVDSNIDFSLDRVRVAGAARLPGAYPRATVTSVGRLINGVENLAPNAFTPFSIIVRRDPRLNTQTIIPFSLARVLSRTDDIPFQNEDIVYVFTRAEMHDLAAVAAATVIATSPNSPISAQGNNPYDALSATQTRRGANELSGLYQGAGTFAGSQYQPGLNSAGSPNGYAPNGFPANGFSPNGASNPGFVSPNFQPSTGANGVGAFPSAGPLGNAPYTVLSPQVGSYLAPAVPGQPTGAYTVLDNNPADRDSREPRTNQQQLLPRTATTAGAAPADAGANANAPSPVILRPEVEPNDVLTPLWLTAETRREIRNIAQQLGVTTDMLVRMATDHLIWVLDQVKEPGVYLAAGTPTLQDIIEIAGGPLETADLSFVEVTSTSIDALAGASRTLRTGYKGTPEDFRRVSLRALDVIRLRPVFSDRDQGQVTVAGQVRFPGNFDITRAERLSTLLERAGGLTEEAYPYGAIFTRRRAMIAEREANIREARQLESQAATPSALSLSADQAQNVAQRTQLVRTLSQQLRDAPVLGRIAVTADPAILRVRPELDILLEPGDTLYIPKRPSTITVSGEVLNNGSFQYESGLSVNDYLERAGGTTQGADEGRTFVVLPDGSARIVSENWLSFSNAAMIPPGSTIIVPRDLQPFSFGPFVRDVTQIMSQLAITAASLAIINR